MKPEQPPVKEALILICRKCGTKLDHRDSAEDLKKALKSEIKDRGEKKLVRAVLTDCIDLCPKGRIAATVVRFDGKPTEVLTLSEEDLELSTGALLDKLLHR